MNSAKVEHDDINWEDILSDLDRHMKAYQENIFVAKELNPIVFVWSDTSKYPMPNPTVNPNDLETWNNAVSNAEEAQRTIIKFQKMLQKALPPGKTVTAETLAQYAKPGVTPSALAMALGVSLDRDISENYPLRVSLDLVQKLADLWRVNKSLPILAHYSEEKNAFGTNSGMRLRWNAAHNYMHPITVTGELKDLSSEDRFAIHLATKLSGGKSQQTGKASGGKPQWKVFLWLRPAQEAFYQSGRQTYIGKHGINKARGEIARIEEERRKMVTGDIKPYALINKYEHETVQQRTHASKRIASKGKKSDGTKVISDNAPAIPITGQHGLTPMPMHEGEESRLKLGRPKMGTVSMETLQQNLENAKDLQGAPKYNKTQIDDIIEYAKKEGKLFGAPHLSKKDVHLIYETPGQSGAVPHSVEGHDLPTLYNALKEGKYKLGEGDAKDLENGRTIRTGAWNRLYDDARKGEIEIGGETRSLSSDEMDRWDKAAARIAVDQGALHSMGDFHKLSTSIQEKFRKKVLKQLQQNMHQTTRDMKGREVWLHGTPEMRREMEAQQQARASAKREERQRLLEEARKKGKKPGSSDRIILGPSGRRFVVEGGRSPRPEKRTIPRRRGQPTASREIVVGGRKFVVEGKAEKPSPAATSRYIFGSGRRAPEAQVEGAETSPRAEVSAPTQIESRRAPRVATERRAETRRPAAERPPATTRRQEGARRHIPDVPADVAEAVLQAYKDVRSAADEDIEKKAAEIYDKERASAVERLKTYGPYVLAQKRLETETARRLRRQLTPEQVEAITEAKPTLPQVKNAADDAAVAARDLYVQRKFKASQVEAAKAAIRRGKEAGLTETQIRQILTPHRASEAAPDLFSRRTISGKRKDAARDLSVDDLKKELALQKKQLETWQGKLEGELQDQSSGYTTEKKKVARAPKVSSLESLKTKLSEIKTSDGKPKYTDEQIKAVVDHYGLTGTLRGGPSFFNITDAGPMRIFNRPVVRPTEDGSAGTRGSARYQQAVTRVRNLTASIAQLEKEIKEASDKESGGEEEDQVSRSVSSSAIEAAFRREKDRYVSIIKDYDARIESARAKSSAMRNRAVAVADKFGKDSTEHKKAVDVYTEALAQFEKLIGQRPERPTRRSIAEKMMRQGLQKGGRPALLMLRFERPQREIVEELSQKLQVALRRASQ